MTQVRPNQKRRQQSGTGRAVAVRVWGTVLAAMAVALAMGGAAAPAFAQEFVKVEDGAREQLPATPFVGIAYGFIWAAILVYVFVLARGLGRVQKDLRDLRRRLDQSEGDAGGAGALPR